MRARVTRDRRVGWMTALCVAAVALASTAMLVTSGGDPAPEELPATSDPIGAGQFGIRTYDVDFDGVLVTVDIELVNESEQPIIFELDQLTAVDADGAPAPMVASIRPNRLEAGTVEPASTLRGLVSFATSGGDGSVELTFTSDQLAAPLAGIPIDPS